MHLAVLLTCHNRRAKTLECLERVLTQKVRSDITVEIFLVDDGSTDGTDTAVRHRFPQVHLIHGDGTLFWNGGMRRAWNEAAKDDFDSYLWLNDDTMLLPGAIEILTGIVSAPPNAAAGDALIVIGYSRDAITGIATYGELGPKGLVPPPDSRPRLLPPRGTFNGNLVLVTRGAFRMLGNLSADYCHSFGDVDYGFRAHRAGVPMVVAPGILAECQPNPIPRWRRADVPFRERWRQLHSPKGCSPREAAAFYRVAHGWTWPFWVALLYWRIFRPRQPSTK